MDYFFENPYLLVIALVVAGAAGRIVGRRRGSPALANGGVVAMVLAVALVTAARFVETDREAVTRHVRGMLSSAEAAGTGGQAHAAAAPLGDWFADAVELQGADGTRFETLDAGRIAEILRRHRVRGHGLRSLEVAAAGGVATTRLRLTSRVGEGYPAPTQWELHWTQRGGGDWRIDRMRWLAFRGQPPRKGMY